MTTSAGAAPAVRAAFAQLVDYAGLFPPAKLAMLPALEEYAQARTGPHSWMLGRFITPASRLPELREAFRDTGPLELSFIIDAGNDPRTWLAAVQAAFANLRDIRAEQNRLRIEVLETSLPPLATQRETYDASIGQFAAAAKQAGLADLPIFVELPRDARWTNQLQGALFALSRHGMGAKLRCGGPTPETFPSTEDVVRFICTAVQEHQVPLKATAGLHHPVRHFDENIGTTMHGFLNVLAAAAFARSGLDSGGIQRIVACENPAAFRFDENGLWFDRERVGVEDLKQTRERAFISYGSCSFDEPTTDLQALGLL